MTHTRESALSVVPIETSVTVTGITVKLVLDPINQWLEVYIEDMENPKYARDLAAEFRRANARAIDEAVHSV